MDDERSVERENPAHRQCQNANGSSIAANSAIRDNQYYDPVHESRGWYQGISSTQSQPSHISQIASSNSNLPSFVAFQGLSNNTTSQESPIVPGPAPAPDLSTQDRMPFNDVRHIPETYSAVPYSREVRTSNPESNSLNTRNLFYTAPFYTGTTVSEFVSPMFLSNPELALIDANRAQRSYAIMQQNTPDPIYMNSRTELRNPVSSQQELDINFPSNVRSILSQTYPQSRRRNRSHLPNSEEQNNVISHNENVTIQRRRFEVAFGTSVPDNERSLAVMRGAIASGKRIPSREAMASLETVKLEELDESDRSCIICYNDFGIKNPEGIVEIPLRLPKCKHVFGDKCIKKWFEDSYSCPYCRDKLPSELSLKKICGIESFRDSSENMNNTRHRVRNDGIRTRYNFTVDITNTRLAQPIQSSSVTEPPGQPVGGIFDRNSHWQITPTNRILATDSYERLRRFRTRGTNYRSNHNFSRQSNTGSSRTIHLNSLPPPLTEIGPQVPVPLGSNLPSFNTALLNSSDTSRLNEDQNLIVQTSPSTWHSSGQNGSNLQTSEIAGFSIPGATIPSLSRQNYLDHFNEARDEMRRSIEDASISFHASTTNGPIFRVGHQDILSHSPSPGLTSTEPQRIPPLHTALWQSENSRPLESSETIPSPMYNSREARSGEVITRLSQTPPQSVI